MSTHQQLPPPAEAPAPLPTAGSGRIFSKPVLAWASWDWGSAAFNAIMTTFVFTVYLTSEAFGGEERTSQVLGWGLAAAGLLIALLAPVTGQRSDSGGRRKLWLGVNTLIAAELHAPWRPYLRRLWVRLHGRDVRGLPMDTPDELWDLLDGVARSVILDHRTRVKNALSATALAPIADTSESRAS